MVASRSDQAEFFRRPRPNSVAAKVWKVIPSQDCLFCVLTYPEDFGSVWTHYDVESNGKVLCTAFEGKKCPRCSSSPRWYAYVPVLAYVGGGVRYNADLFEHSSISKKIQHAGFWRPVVLELPASAEENMSRMKPADVFVAHRVNGAKNGKVNLYRQGFECPIDDFPTIDLQRALTCYFGSPVEPLTDIMN